MMRLRAICVALSLWPAASAAAESVALDIFDLSALPADAWQPLGKSDPVAPAQMGTQRATQFICRFANLPSRGGWDHNTALDLSRFGRFSFQIHTDHPQHITHASLYFRSAKGWYAGHFRLHQPGATTITLGKADFDIEDKPTGWHAIDGVRLAFWKRGDTTDTARFTVSQLQAHADSVVVVRGNRSILKRSTNARDVQKYTDATVDMLGDLGLSVSVLDDTDVEAGGLSGAKIAVFPFNPDMTLREVQAIGRFVAAGGRIIVFYTLPKPLGELLGITESSWQRSRKGGLYTSIHFDAKALPGLPESFMQNSWNARLPDKLAPGTKVLGTWHDGIGRPIDQPAVTLNRAGAFMGHVLLPDDREQKLQMLLALLMAFDPNEVATATDALRHAVRFAGLEDMAGLGRFIKAQSAAIPAPRAQRATELFDLSQRAFDQIDRVDTPPNTFQARDNLIELVFRTRAVLRQAYFVSLPSRVDEFRGVWCHSAFGLPNQTWAQSMTLLSEHGVDVVMPNMLWGGLAYYPSDVLPVSNKVKGRADPLAECITAARRHDIAVHVWKVNWNLAYAPDAFIEQMRSEWRLQQDVAGRELPWLCPSHPENFELELQSILEVIGKYPVDGFHFDYIRYPHSRTCYCDGCRIRFEQAHDVTVTNWPDGAFNGEHTALYRTWRAAQITRLVAAVSEQARRIRPEIKISAAVFTQYPDCRNSVGQDWLAWVNRGYLDFICPMNYTTANAQFTRWTRDQLQLVDGRIPVYPGVGVSVDQGLTAVQTAEQIVIARQAGAPGFVLFQLDDHAADQVLPALRRGITAD